MSRESTLVTIPVNSINIQATREHIAQLIITQKFDSNSITVLEQTIIMLDHYEELLFSQP
ncbi:hypothetical protein Q4503_13285 [Colwellia sp. 6_MG-2023]|uniref:hypothetical protein n=1 Tax=Colwellia sp. 6_MG-2023 TaxID=3062676 RepID=UPI0026E26288|nr:hypothetical protein [Colwellia sp. 6_MG-2023]MDO6488674.1 hypothetical protein [Colwellia sp. 6_MG-2023]